MMKRRINPAVFATIVVGPIVVLELILLAMGVWPMSGAMIFVLVINVVFWLMNYFIWRQAGRARS